MNHNKLPKKPVPAYFKWRAENYNLLKKKYPDDTPAQFKRRVAHEWENYPLKDKARLEDEFRKKLNSYKILKEQWDKEHGREEDLGELKKENMLSHASETMVVDSKKKMKALKTPFECFSEEMAKKVNTKAINSEADVKTELTKKYLSLSFKDLEQFLTNCSSKNLTSKALVYYVVKYEDIDYHNDRHGGIRDKDIKGIFTSKEKANQCVQSHFAGWDKDFFEERLKYRNAETGLIHIKALCPEGEVMECWTEVMDKNSKHYYKYLQNRDKQKERNEESSELGEWTDNCDDSDGLYFDNE